MTVEREQLKAWASEALEGNRASQEKLLAALRPRFLRFVLRHTGNADLAEEIAQEAMVKIYEKMHHVRDPGAFEGWAFQVCSNAMRDHFRKGKRTEEMKERLSSLPPPAASFNDPVQWSSRNEMLELLGWAISQLDEKHRVVLQLHELEDLDHAEIARAIGIPEGTVWSRLYYARKALRDILKTKA